MVPDTAHGQYTYMKGTKMNVTWWTTYPQVNLFLIFGQNYDTPYWIASMFGSLEAYVT